MMEGQLMKLSLAMADAPWRELKSCLKGRQKNGWFEDHPEFIYSLFKECWLSRMIVLNLHYNQGGRTNEISLIDFTKTSMFESVVITFKEV